MKILLVSCLLLAGSQVLAQSSGYAPRHPLTDPPPPAADVQTQYWFPSHPQLQFPAGTPIDVVVGIHNGGSQGLNFTAIMASLNAKDKFSFYIQNFTFVEYDTYVPAGEEASLQYTFMPDGSLPQLEFQVAVQLFYNNQAKSFSNTVFNSTIDVIELSSFIDFQLLGLWGLVLAVLGVGGFFLYKYILGMPFMKQYGRRTKRKPVQTTVTDTDPAEWLKGTFANMTSPQKPKRRSSASGAKPGMKRPASNPALNQR
ncbi:hypothetical protein WJX84_010463 [Apatococcus fuscideae]|uniref:Translocon-associated protein subunit alpha n=1 Tax=Apatococcus fuscideae TaxID=2026836 RepID=A0AAW1TBP9_9CHLO